MDWSIGIRRKKKTITLIGAIGVVLSLANYVTKYFPWPLVTTSAGLISSIGVVISLYDSWESQQRRAVRRLLKVVFGLCFIFPMIFVLLFVSLLLFNYHYIKYPDGEDIWLTQGQRREEIKITGRSGVYSVNVPYKSIVETALVKGTLAKRVRLDFQEVADVLPDPIACPVRNLSVHRDDRTAGVVSIRFGDPLSPDGCRLTVSPLGQRAVFVEVHYLWKSRVQEVVEWFTVGYYRRFP